jgi:hypothetical protein
MLGGLHAVEDNQISSPQTRIKDVIELRLNGP